MVVGADHWRTARTGHLRHQDLTVCGGVATCGDAAVQACDVAPARSRRPWCRWRGREENAARQEIGTTKPTAKLTAHETQLLESILDRKIKDTLDQQMPPMTAGAHSGTGDPTRISMADSDPTTTAFDVEHDAPTPEDTAPAAGPQCRPIERVDLPGAEHKPAAAIGAPLLVSGEPSPRPEPAAMDSTPSEKQEGRPALQGGLFAYNA